MADRLIGVEVAYAEPDRQVVKALDVPPGTTAWEAVLRAGLEAEFPGMEPDPAMLGIFGRSVAPETVLREGDRVEVYRRLEVDPKESRRRRAARRR